MSSLYQCVSVYVCVCVASWVYLLKKTYEHFVPVCVCVCVCMCLCVCGLLGLSVKEDL